MKHKLLTFKLRSMLTLFFLSFILISEAQYCESYFENAEYEHIKNVNFAGINNSSGGNDGDAVDYTSQVASVSPNGSYLINIKIKADEYDYVYVFIDWNQNGILDDAGEVYTIVEDTDQSGIYSLPITAPADALAGNTIMRVMIIYDDNQPDPCIDAYNGEAEDYTVNVVTSACAGTPDPGNTTSTNVNVCSTTTFILGLENQVTGTGITYQWQISPDGVAAYTDIAGATTSTYATTQSSGNFYQCVVTCSGVSENSTPIQINQNILINCYCESIPESPYGEDILNVTLGTLNNSSDCSETGGGDSQINQYSDYTSVAAPILARGVTYYNFSVEIGACDEAYENMTKVFIDFNQDGDFSDPGEQVYVTTDIIDGAHIETGEISIPLNAALGTTRMRVITSETSYEEDIEACGGEYYYAGETEDYFVTIGPVPACPQPTAFHWTNGTTTSASFAWTPVGTETEWIVEYGAPGFTLGSGTTMTVTGTPEVTIPLTGNAFYKIHVRAVCSSTSESFSTGPVYFDTYGYGQYMEADAACGPGFINISTTGTLYTLDDDDNAGITLPFPVYYQGAMHTQATIGNNGGLVLGTLNGDVDYSNGTMTSAPIGLYPFWDDMSDTGPGIWSATIGTAPNRKFVVQWNKDRLGVEGNPLNYEIIIDEATMEIYFVYDDVFTGDDEYDNGASATIGVAGPHQDIQLSMNNTSYLDANGCAHFYYTNCPKPKDLTFSNIAIDEFSMDWVAGLSGETEWTVEFGEHGFVPGTGTNLTQITSSDQQIPDLDPLTTYDVYVYAVCANGETSLPTIGSVQTLPLCADPYALYATTEPDSIFTSWEWTETEVPLTGFNLQYGPTNFTLYSTAGTIIPADGMNFEDTIHNVDFMAGASYDVYVQSVCGTDTSNFIGPFKVTMPLTNDTVCYAETLLVNGTVYVFSNVGATVSNGIVSNQEQSIAPPNTGLQTTTGWGNSTISFSTWFKFVAPASGSVRISGVDKGFDGQMAVYKVGNCAQFSTFQLIAANDNEIGGTSLAPNFTVCGLTAGATYYLMHDSYSLYDQGTYSIKMTPINLEAGVGTSEQICSGQSINLFDVLSGNDANGMWIPTIPSVALLHDSIFNSAGLGYQTFDFQYRMVDGCAYDSAVSHIVVFPPSNAGTDGSVIVCRNQPFNLLQGLGGTVNMGGTWYSPTSTVVPGGNVIAANFPGQYNYRYIVGNGVCPNDTSKVIVSVQSCNYLGLDETAFEGFNLYPNPTDGLVYISNTGSTEVFNYEVLDLNGRKVLHKENAINGTVITEIDLNSMETGVYMIHVYNASAEKTFRIVVK